MTLLVDLGNTRLKCALHDGGVLQPVQAFAHIDDADAALAQLDAWLAGGVAPTDALLASVAAPALTRRVTQTLARHGHRVRQPAVQAATSALRVAYAQPERLGVDRWLAMLAARARASTPVLLASVGSALTVDAVDVDGLHLGGLIAPTPDAMREALFARAPHLRGAPAQVRRFAASTEDAVSSGAVLAAAALIERSWQELAHRLEVAAPRLLLSGGGSEPLRRWLPPHEHVPDLVLHGLLAWAADACGE
ncbi:type III pantothenate kinase [Chiayiivirga flava]|uniref:Type III pantothenate kinase n=1 Tax=Chiayiivirga flava TaxID=659595 RepID=A0A7W8DAC5_9GAMM|nr:type III pantothenate kinase [Chiayiivirga flava]MBB5209700.1 type III pantothenate kinase [Chiayiivirga flava]